MNNFIKILYFMICVILLHYYDIIFFGPDSSVSMALFGACFGVLLLTPLMVWGHNYICSRQQRMKKNDKTRIGH